MNQITRMQIDNIASRMRKIIRSKALKDTTLSSILAEYKPVSDDVYLALDLLARENEIFFLQTPGETYIIPIS